MTFKFRSLGIPDVILIRTDSFLDPRGRFMEAYKQSEFRANGLSHMFVQDNYSHSIRGVVRGLHYQLQPMAQAKLVSVVRGEIFDVAVDIRVGSPSYGKWVGVRLLATEPQLLFVPSGFAHGFQVLSEKADVVYKVTKEYAPEHDRGIAWNDPDLGISWPIATANLSTKDSQLPPLSEAENNFMYEETEA